MSPGVWQGKNILKENRILILGESHYGSKEDIGTPVPYPTSSVVEEYLSHREPGGDSRRWDRFFDRIAASFGYSKDNVKEFYDKIYFGNYVPVLCGIGKTNVAKYYINENRTKYNDSLFCFVNQNNVSTIVCFSKASYWNLPTSAEEDIDSSLKIKIQLKTGYLDTINVYKYAPDIKHNYCDTVLKQPLKVYGIRHPSSRRGYNSEAVYNEICKEEELKYITSYQIT